jgi:hypothetical protein
MTATTTAATSPRKPNNRSRQVARLAASHQMSRRRQQRRGPKTEIIQYFAIESAETSGPNLPASMSSANNTAGHALNGRNVGVLAESILCSEMACSCSRSFIRVICYKPQYIRRPRFASELEQEGLGWKSIIPSILPPLRVGHQFRAAVARELVVSLHQHGPVRAYFFKALSTISLNSLIEAWINAAGPVIFTNTLPLSLSRTAPSSMELGCGVFGPPGIPLR